VKKHYAGLFDLLSRVNMTRDSMDDDEDTVIPTNFIVVGSILNQFIRALSQHMVRLFWSLIFGVRFLPVLKSQ
jgi:hypothetical protein